MTGSEESAVAGTATAVVAWVAWFWWCVVGWYLVVVPVHEVKPLKVLVGAEK